MSNIVFRECRELETWWDFDTVCAAQEGTQWFPFRGNPVNLALIMHWTLKPQGYWGHFFEVAECPQTMLKLVIDESGRCAAQWKARAAVKLISRDTLLLVIALFYRALDFSLFYRTFQTLYLGTVKQLKGEELPHLTQHRLGCWVCWCSHQRLGETPRQPNCTNVIWDPWSPECAIRGERCWVLYSL